MAKAKGKGSKAASKGEIIRTLTEKTGLSKKQVSGFFDSLAAMVAKDLKSRGIFGLPGLVKIKTVEKPAQPAREGINPFTKQPMMFKARPARKVVKALPLKALKEMV